MSACPGDFDGPPAVRHNSNPDDLASMSPGIFDYQSVNELRPEATRFSANIGIEQERASSTQPQIISDRQSSLSLCISAIIGLGLCSSAHCVRKLSFGFIPEWYHNGGPFQIGHSFAVCPDSVCPAPVCCLVQPAVTAEDFLPQYHLGTVVSLWRKSQFTPDVIASRGPPIVR
jgi:hypothetical protein